MVAVSHYLSLSGGKKKSKIQDRNPRHDEVRCLIVNIITVSGVSLPEMILHCEIQNGPLSPDWGHMPLSFPVTKILLWHNINIRDVTQQSVQCDPTNKIRFVSSTDWPSVIPLYFYLWTKRGQWGDSGGEGIFIWLDKYTRRLVISWQIIDKPLHRYFIDFRWII